MAQRLSPVQFDLLHYVYTFQGVSKEELLKVYQRRTVDSCIYHGWIDSFNKVIDLTLLGFKAHRKQLLKLKEKV